VTPDNYPIICYLVENDTRTISGAVINDDDLTYYRLLKYPINALLYTFNFVETGNHDRQTALRK